MKPLDTRPSTGPHPQGRPSKLTPAMHTKICDMLRKGNYVTTVASACGLHPQTIHTWRRRGSDPNYAPEGVEFDEDGFTLDFYGDFARDTTIAMAQAEVEAVGSLKDHFDRDWRAAAEFLQRKFPERWNPKVVMELSGKDGGPIEVSESKEAFLSKIDVMEVERTGDIEDAEVIEDKELEAGEEDTEQDWEQLSLDV